MKISCKRAAATTSWWLVVVAGCCAVLVSAVDDQEKQTEEQETQSQQQVAILKQINRVNDDGSYTFGYEAADGSFKIETRDVLGNVKGMFGFIDESGDLKRVSYSASNNTGFQSTGSLASASEKQELPARVPPSTPPLLYQQIIRPSQDPQITTRRPVFRPVVSRDSQTTTTDRPPLDSTTRGPVLLYAQSVATPGVSEAPDTVTRPAVIQTIPRVRRPQEIPNSTDRPLVSTTTRRPLQLYGQYIRQQPGVPGGEPVKQIFVTPAPIDEKQEHAETTTLGVTGVIYGHYIRPTSSPETTSSVQLPKRVVLARRPLETSSTTESPVLLHSKQPEDNKAEAEEKRRAKSNAIRRQLAQDRGPPVQFPSQLLRRRQSGTDDQGDVYGGSIGGSPRPIPTTPFRSYFTPTQPRPAQSSVLQTQLLQGIPAVRQRPGTYPQDDLDPRIPPGAIPSGVGGSVRIPLGVIRGGVLDPRVPPGAFQYPGQSYPYPAPQGSSYPYPTPQGSSSDLQEQLLQLLLGRQQPRQPPYINDYQYRQQAPAQPALTPFQIALMMTLGENIPPELLDDPYQQNVNRQQPIYNQQVPYNRQQIPYSVPYNTQQIPYPQQQVPYPQAAYSPQQIPYNQALPYDPQQSVYPQYQQPYPGNYQGQIPYQIPYNIRRRLRYRPQPVYSPPLPYANGQPVAPDYYQQPLAYGGRSGLVGYPQDFLPDEYRDALILRMLLAARAAQQQARGQQHRPVDQNPNIQERSQPYLTTDSTTTSTTTVRPRTLAPVRNVQILDPLTEETTAKRSTTTKTAPQS